MSNKPSPFPPNPTNLSTAEPWLRGTHTEIDALRRQVLHALELTVEDAQRWCGALTDDELDLRPLGLPSVAFQLRHIVHSLDRLMTYAEDRQLSQDQLADLQSEAEPGARHQEIFAEFEAAISSAANRIRQVSPTIYESARGVGRAHLPTTVGGLLIHCAEHTQRHTGQAVTTAKVILALRRDL